MVDRSQSITSEFDYCNAHIPGREEEHAYYLSDKVALISLTFLG